MPCPLFPNNKKYVKKFILLSKNLLHYTQANVYGNGREYFQIKYFIGNSSLAWLSK